jgi:hypothetical protein
VRSRTTVLTVALVLLAGCGGGGGGGGDEAAATAPAPRPAKGAAPWPRPSDPLRRIRLAGLRPEYREFLSYHVHAHLDVFVNGQAEPVPAGVGIEIHDPGVRHGPDANGRPAYGGIRRCEVPCISPLHTHDYTGVLHTESQQAHANTLGEFFIEWGVRLDRECVGGYCRPRAPISIVVDGQRFTGDPRQIALTNGKEIAIVIGTAPESIPSEIPS